MSFGLVQGSALAQTISNPALPQWLLWLVTIASFGYLTYQYFMGDDQEKFSELLTGTKAIVIILAVFVLSQVNIAPAFGWLSGIITYVMEFVTAGLMGVFFSVILVVFHKFVVAETDMFK